MNRSSSLIVLLFLTGSLLAEGGAPGQSETGRTRILVTFSDPAIGSSARVTASRPGYKRSTSTYLVSLGVRRTAKRIASEFKLKIVDEWPILSLRVHCLVYEVPDKTDIDDLLLRLQQTAEVDSAQRLNVFEVSAENELATEKSYANLQHSLDMLELAQAHQWSRGDHIRISIIDTAVDTEHPDLKASISSQHDFVSHVAHETSSKAHGTAVAGVIGADADNGIGIIGVAPASRLQILRACWHQPNRSSAVCDSFTLAKSLDYAIDSKSDIINLSLNGPSDALLGRMVEQALENGIVVIAAAPEHSRSGFPAELDGVIAVGTSQPPQMEQAQHLPQIRAPGTDILVAVPKGRYDFASGSSLSAAHVTGIVALLIASRPRLSTEKVRSLLIGSQSANYGSVNACLALAELLSKTGCQQDQLVSERF
ncbi:MAG TPA: S8 family serine peptidase [Xanthomonadales bacterium]|nr:S8 family serine peptidase [Xanthomonadales bacterium]